MNSIVRLYSNKKGEISRFLNDFLGQILKTQ